MSFPLRQIVADHKAMRKPVGGIVEVTEHKMNEREKLDA